MVTLASSDKLVYCGIGVASTTYPKTLGNYYMRLISCSGVLAADLFNLSIFSQIWLIDNKILSREETASDPNTYFSPMAVNVKSNGYDLLVIPERAQVLLQGRSGHEAELFLRILGGIAKNLPHTPYQGAGFNFDYVIPVSDANVLKRVRSCFMPENSPISADFLSNDARFGFYVSQDIDDSLRLRLDIKPAIINNADSIVLKFNVHREMNKAPTQQIEDFFNRFEELDNKCRDIADKINAFIVRGE